MGVHWRWAVAVVWVTACGAPLEEAGPAGAQAVLQQAVESGGLDAAGTLREPGPGAQETAPFHTVAAAPGVDLLIVPSRTDAVDTGGDASLWVEVTHGLLTVHNREAQPGGEGVLRVRRQAVVFARELERVVARWDNNLQLDGLEVDHLVIRASGQSTVGVSGRARCLRVDATQGTRVFAQQLRARRAVFFADTDASVFLRVLDRVEGVARDDGRVDVFGDPERRDVFERGRARIRFRDDSEPSERDLDRPREDGPTPGRGFFGE